MRAVRQPTAAPLSLRESGAPAGRAFALRAKVRGFAPCAASRHRAPQGRAAKPPAAVHGENAKDFKGADMKKILVITTGGTIACGSRENGLNPEIGGQRLAEGLAPKNCEVRFLDLFSVDSTDISPSHWEKLNSAINSAKRFDGVIVLHGTDTLEYTAAILSITARRDIPVIITGSMIPMEADGSDAPQNLSDSFAAACSEKLAGVHVVFCGRVVPGNLAVKRSTAADAFRCFSGEEYGHISGGAVGILKETSFPKQLPFPREFAPVAIRKLTPFACADELSAHGCCGMVIEGCGAGGLPDRPELIEAVRTLAKKIPVIMTTACIGGADLSLYSVGRRALGCGILDGGTMSTAFAAALLFCTQGNFSP